MSHPSKTEAPAKKRVIPSKSKAKTRGVTKLRMKAAAVSESESEEDEEASSQSHLDGATSARVAAAEATGEPPLWHNVFDATSGRPYWYNRNTKETTWTDPTGGDTTSADTIAPPASTLATDTIITTDWREAKDETSGRPYWYHRLTKERTWVNPLAGGGVTEDTTTLAQKKSTIVIPKKSKEAQPPSNTVAASSSSSRPQSSSLRINSASSKRRAASDVPADFSLFDDAANDTTAVAAAVPSSLIPLGQNQLTANDLFTVCMDTIQGEPTRMSQDEIKRMRENAELAYYLLVSAPIDSIQITLPLDLLARVLHLTITWIETIRDPSHTNQLITLAFELARIAIVKENQPQQKTRAEIVPTLEQCSGLIKKSLKLLESSAPSPNWSFVKLSIMKDLLSPLTYVVDSSSTTFPWQIPFAQSIRDLMHPHLRNTCTEYSDRFRSLQESRPDVHLMGAMCLIDSRYLTFTHILRVMSLPTLDSTVHDPATTLCLHAFLLGRMLLELARCDGTPRPEAMTHKQRAFLSKCILKWSCETSDGKREMREEIQSSEFKDLITPDHFASTTKGFLSGSQFITHLTDDDDFYQTICKQKISIIFDLLECHGASQSEHRVTARFDHDTLVTLADCIIERFLHQTPAPTMELIVDRYSTTTSAVRDLLDASWLRNRGTTLASIDHYVQTTFLKPPGLVDVTDFKYEMERMKIESALSKDVERIVQATMVISRKDIVRPLIQEMPSIPTPLPPLEQYIHDLQEEAKSDHVTLPLLFPYTLNEAICEAASLRRPLLIHIRPRSAPIRSLESLIKFADALNKKFVTLILPDDIEEADAVRTLASTPFIIMHGRRRVTDLDRLDSFDPSIVLDKSYQDPVVIDVPKNGSQLIDPSKKATREEWMQSAAELKKPLVSFLSFSLPPDSTQDEKETADGLFSDETPAVDLKQKTDDQVAITITDGETSNNNTKTEEKTGETEKPEQKVEGEEDEDEDEENLEQKKKGGINVKSSDSQPDNTAGAGGPAIDDRPTGDDKLSHGKYAEKLAEVLCSPRTQPPITVGVYAQWGGGKSFFLEKLKSFLLSKLDIQNALWQESQDEELRRQDELRSQDIDTEEAKQAYRYKWSWLINKKREEKQKKKSARRRRGDEEENEDSDGDDDDEEEKVIEESDPLTTSQPTSWWQRLRPQYIQLHTTDENANFDPKSTQRPPQPVPRLVRFAKKIGLQYTAMKAIMRIWKVMSRANRDVDSIKPLPVRMKFIEFNSWLYSGSDCLWAAFASHLFEQTEAHFGSLTTRIYRARYNDAFGKLSKTLLITVVIIFGLIVAAGICVWKRVGPFAESDGEDTSDIRTKAFAGLGSAFAFAFLGLLASSRDVISNLIRSQADEVLRTMDRPDFSSRMGFMNSIKTEIDIISSLMRHGEFYDDETGEEYRSQFVIFIDDLDRCPADKVVEVLKALVLLFSSPNAPFIAVLAIDPRLIVQAIETVHAIGGHNRGTQGPGGSAEAMVNGYEYLDKIVQLPFCFPDLQATDKHRLLNSFLPLDQNLKEAAQQSDYREVATLIMKSFLGNPQAFREELKGCIHQQLDEWLRVKAVQCIETAKSTFVNPLSKQENIEFTLYLKAKKENETATNTSAAASSTASSALDSDSELRSIFSILIPLVTSPESRFSVTDHLKSHPFLTFAELEKRVKRELKKVLKRTETKYMEQYEKEKMEVIELWRDETARAKRQAAQAHEGQLSQTHNSSQETEEQKLMKLREKVRAVLSSPRTVEFLTRDDQMTPFDSTDLTYSSLYTFFNKLLSNTSSIHPDLLQSIIELRNDIRAFDLETIAHPRLSLTSSAPSSVSLSLCQVKMVKLMAELMRPLGQILSGDTNAVDVESFQSFSQLLLEAMFACIQTTMTEDSTRWMMETTRASGRTENEEEEKKEEEMEEQMEAFFHVQMEAQQLISSPTIADDITSNNNPLSSPSNLLMPSDPVMSPATQSISKKKAWDATLNVDLLATGTLDTTPVPLTASSATVSAFSEGDALPDSTPLPPHPFSVPTPDVPTQALKNIDLNQVEALTQMVRDMTTAADQGAMIKNTLALMKKLNASIKEKSSEPAITPATTSPSSFEPAAAVQEEKEKEIITSESVAAFNAKPRSKRKILPRQLIMDYGFTNHDKFTGGWVDLQGQGVPNDYARFVRPSKAHDVEPFLSVALAGSIYPYSPEGQFEWDEESKCVRVGRSMDPLTPIIYDHPFFIGESGRWAKNASGGLSYARQIRDGAGGITGRYFSVTSSNLVTHSRRDEYDGSKGMLQRSNFQLEGPWWNANDQAWYEWKRVTDGAPKKEESNDCEQTYRCFRIESSTHQTVNSSTAYTRPPEPSYFALKFAGRGLLMILGEPHVTNARGEMDQGCTHKQMQQAVHSNYAYSYDMTYVTEVLVPTKDFNNANESNPKTWYRHGYQPSPYVKHILADSTSLTPYRQRTKEMKVENEANSAQEIWITAMYSYAKCTNQHGIKAKDAPAALPDYSFTLTATLMSAQDHILDRRIIRGVTLPASTPAGHADLTGWRTVSCVFRPDELIAPDIPVAKIRFEEILTRAGTEVKEMAMMIRPQVLGFTSPPQTREELWRRVEEKVKIENAEREERFNKRNRFVQILTGQTRQTEEKNRLAQADMIEKNRSTDLLLTHIMRTRTLPHYRTTPPSWTLNDRSAYMSQAHLSQSLLDEFILPSELVKLDNSLMPLLIELTQWVSNPMSTWEALLCSRTHPENDSLPQYAPSKNDKPYDILEKSLKWIADFDESLLQWDKLHDPNECVSILKKCIASWLLRSVTHEYNEYLFANTSAEDRTAMRQLQYLAPLSLPRDTDSSLLEVEKREGSTGIIYSLVCRAHLSHMYLLAPKIMPLFELFSEAVQHGLDKAPIDFAIAGHMRFLQYPCVRLITHYTSDQRFVKAGKEWQGILVQMKVIPQLWKSFDGRNVNVDRPDDDKTVSSLLKLHRLNIYDWSNQLHTMIAHDEPRSGSGTLRGDEMKLNFWKEVEKFQQIRMYFPEFLEVVEKKIKELTAEIEAKEDEDDESSQAGFSLRPIEIVAIGQAAPFLDGNPRRIKRIMNIYNVSRLLVERKRHQHHYRDECTHSFCQQYNADKKSTAASLAFNPLASEMSLHSVFHPPRLTYSLVRPGLFRFILLLEQWPYRTAWLLHIIAQSSKKWKHAQEAIDRVHQTKVDIQKKENKKAGPNNNGSNSKDKPIGSSSSSASPTVMDTIPIDAAMSCGMFPPSMSLLELYRFVQPLIYGHRQPRNYEATALDTKGRNSNATNENQLVLHHHHNHHHAPTAKSKFRTLQNVMKAANAFRSLDEDEELHQELVSIPPAALVPSHNNDLHPAFGVVNKSDFDSSVRRHVHDTEGLLAMDSDPDNFALFLALPLDETKDALDPYDIDLQVDDMTQVEDINEEGTEEDLLLSALHSDLSHSASRSRPQTANHNLKMVSMKTSSSAAHTSLLSPSLMHICDLADLSYLAFNLNPALKRQVAILADLTAAYQPIETLLHQYVLRKYAPPQSRGVSRPRTANSIKLPVHPPPISIPAAISSSSFTSSSSLATAAATSNPTIGSGFARAISRVKSKHTPGSDLLEEKEAHDTALSPSSPSFPMSPFSPAVSDAIKVLPRPPSSQRITATTFQRVSSRTSH